MKFVARPIEVDAYVIVDVLPTRMPDGSIRVVLDYGGVKQATPAMTSRMDPKVGDYWVIQSDGYEYLNPAKVFLAKYRAMNETASEPVESESNVQATPPRQLTAHIVPGDSANHQLKIEVLDAPGQGNACHLYQVSNYNSGTNPSDPFFARYGQPSDHSTILFQNGPIKEVGVNGVTHEAFLAVLIDRLEGFQSGPYANEHNKAALFYGRLMLDALQARTRERIARSVEGTHAI